MAAQLGDQRWRETLEKHDRLTRELVGGYGGKAIKSTGDGFLATFDGPARAIRCATTLGERIEDLGLKLRAGLHTGEVEMIGADIGGMAVHIGARIGALGSPGRGPRLLDGPRPGRRLRDRVRRARRARAQGRAGLLEGLRGHSGRRRLARRSPPAALVLH